MTLDVWQFVGAMAGAATLHALLVVPAIMFRVSRLIDEHLRRVEDRIEARLVRIEARLLEKPGDTAGPLP